jgi:hypothetical protein
MSQNKSTTKFKKPLKKATNSLIGATKFIYKEPQIINKRLQILLIKSHKIYNKKPRNLLIKCHEIYATKFINKKSHNFY